VPKNLEDLILVSVDDHLIEPPNMFDYHLPAKFKSRAPKVIEEADGAYYWDLEGLRAPGLGLNAVIGRPREEYGVEPVAYDQVRAGCYDVHARIEDMNVNGVLGSICFGSFPGFAGARFQKMEDKELSLAVIRAYNDWHVHEWCGAYPERFIALGHLPLWDPALAVEEVKRLAALGVRTVAFPDSPAALGLPGIHSEIWDPLWKVCSENRVVLSCHIGSGNMPPYVSSESPIDAWITSMPIFIAQAAADWTFAAFWQKYPDLRMALSEGGIGWVPYLLERADFTQYHHSAWTNGQLGGRKPSEIFKKHIITCFIADEFGLKNRGDIGVDMITWECDYPHSDSVWPLSPESLWQQIRDLPEDDIDKITHLNVMREFSYDPISKFGRENCTVGALRAQAKHVDTAPKSRGGRNPRLFQSDRPVTTADVLKVLS
jgi:predicted TIM-barrel fold metal-dependent hydrolase